MEHRKKILILQSDDFLRELLGNLLHKDGFYILNGSSIQSGLKDRGGHHVNTVIVNSDCEDYKGKSTIHYLRNELDNPQIFLIHDGARKVSYLPSEDQMNIKKLSVEEILKRVS